MVPRVQQPNRSRLSCGRLARRRKGVGRTVRARQGTNIAFPLERSAPASFKRLLGRSLPPPNQTTQLLGLICPNSQPPTIGQRQLHRPPACHVVEPAVGGPVNPSAIPPRARYGRTRLNLREGKGTPHHAGPEPERKALFIHLGGEGTKEEGRYEQGHEHAAENEDGARSGDQESGCDRPSAKQDTDGEVTNLGVLVHDVGSGLTDRA